MVKAPIVVRHRDHKRPDLRICGRFRHFITLLLTKVSHPAVSHDSVVAGDMVHIRSTCVPARHVKLGLGIDRRINGSFTISNMVNPLALNGLFCS